MLTFIGWYGKLRDAILVFVVWAGATQGGSMCFWVTIEMRRLEYRL